MDDTLNLVIKALKDNSWPKNSSSLHPFSKILQELCVQNNILLKNDKIVLPKTLHKKALSLVHQNHWGIQKTKQMIRKSFWWPKMNNDVEDLIKTCPFCQEVTPSSQFEPLNPIYMPSHPWEYLYADICDPFPPGEKIFTIIDAYSRHPELYS